MKHKCSIILILAILKFSLLIGTSGCKSWTANRVTYVSLASLIHSVDITKDVYYDYRDKHEVTDETEKKIKKLYTNYQEIIHHLKLTYEITDKIASNDDLVKLVNRFVEEVRLLTGNKNLKIIQ